MLAYRAREHNKKNATREVIATKKKRRMYILYTPEYIIFCFFFVYFPRQSYWSLTCDRGLHCSDEFIDVRRKTTRVHIFMYNTCREFFVEWWGVRCWCFFRYLVGFWRLYQRVSLSVRLDSIADARSRHTSVYYWGAKRLSHKRSELAWELQ